MRLKWVVITVCLIAGFIYYQKQAKWKQFTSQEWAFSVMMPGTPSDMVKKQPTALGNIDIHNFIRMKGRAFYAIAVNKFPIVVNTQQVNYILDGVGGDIEKIMHGKVWSQVPIKFGEYPGRDVKATDLDIGKMFTALNGKYDMNMRVYLANGQIYQIMMFTPSGSPFPEAEGKRFFDSFNIL